MLADPVSTLKLRPACTTGAIKNRFTGGEDGTPTDISSYPDCGIQSLDFSLYTDFTLRARGWPQRTRRRNVQDYLRDHWPVRTEVVDHLVVR